MDCARQPSPLWAALSRHASTDLAFVRAALEECQVGPEVPRFVEALPAAMALCTRAAMRRSNTQQLACVVLDLARVGTGRFVVSQERIGPSGTSRAWVNTEMRRWAMKGIVRTRCRTTHVMDRAALLEIALGELVRGKDSAGWPRGASSATAAST